MSMTDDQSRPAATSDDSQVTYTLTVKDAADLYERAGFSRTPRAIQRHCKNGDLVSLKNLTLLGYEYRISAPSVERHIAQLQQLKAATEPATVRDQPRPVATSGAAETSSEHTADSPRQGATSTDQPRPVAAEINGTSPFVAQLKSENEFLRGQIVVKDTQIKDLTERARETNILIDGLQRLLSPLLGSVERREVPMKGEWQSEKSSPGA